MFLPFLLVNYLILLIISNYIRMLDFGMCVAFIDYRRTESAGIRVVKTMKDIVTGAQYVEFMPSCNIHDENQESKDHKKNNGR